MKTTNILTALAALLFSVAQAQTGQITFGNECYHSDSILRIAPPGLSAPARSIPENSVVSQAPVINFTGNQVISSIYKTIENPTDSSVTFWFPDMPQTDSAFLHDYIWSKVTNPDDTPLTRMQIMNACAYFLKSPYNYRNNGLIFEGQWQDLAMYAKEHSLIGRIYSTYTTQCGNHALHARVIQLMFPDYFSVDDYLFTTVPRHAFTNTKVNGIYAHTDYDVGTCGFMFDNPASPNGWASTDDLRADTMLIDEKYLEDGQDLHEFSTLSEYREVIAENPYNWGGCPTAPPVVLNGTFIMPPHSKITTSVVGPIFFLDTSNPANMQALLHAMTFVDAMKNGCMPCYDSIFTIAQGLWPIDSETLKQLFRGSGITLYDPQKAAGKPFSEVVTYNYGRDSIPYWLLETHSADTLRIGVDTKMPLFVMEAENCEVGDTVIIGSAMFPLWSASHTPNVLTHKEVNYFESGVLYPGDHYIKLSVNANARFLATINDWNIVGGEALVFHTYGDSAAWLPTSIRPVTSTSEKFEARLIDNRTVYTNAHWRASERCCYCQCN